MWQRHINIWSRVLVSGLTHWWLKTSTHSLTFREDYEYMKELLVKRGTFNLITSTVLIFCQQWLLLKATNTQGSQHQGSTEQSQHIAMHVCRWLPVSRHARFRSPDVWLQKSQHLWDFDSSIVYRSWKAAVNSVLNSQEKLFDLTVSTVRHDVSFYMSYPWLMAVV